MSESEKNRCLRSTVVCYLWGCGIFIIKSSWFDHKLMYKTHVSTDVCTISFLLTIFEHDKGLLHQLTQSPPLPLSSKTHQITNILLNTRKEVLYKGSHASFPPFFFFRVLAVDLSTASTSVSQSTVNSCTDSSVTRASTCTITDSAQSPAKDMTHRFLQHAERL